MTLDLSTQALINASSGLFFLALGIFAFIVGRRDPWARSVGALAASFGAFFVTVNLWIADARLPYGPLVAAVTALVLLAVSAGAVAGRVAAGIRGRRAVAMAAFLVYVAVSIAVLIVRGWNGGQADFGTPVSAPSGVVRFLTYGIAFFFAISALSGLAAAAALRFAGSEGREQERWVALALAFGTYSAFYASTQLVGFAQRGPGLDAILLVVGLQGPILAAILLWASNLSVPGAAQARTTMLLLLATTVVSMLVNVALDLDGPRDLGVPGIVRTVGALLLALAIFKRDLLGVPLPQFTVRRGPLAAGALVVLLIVAQIAQNFLSAEYGLLTGGIVAGAFLFAAQPIQRTIERLTDDCAGRSTAAASPSRLAESERAYKVTLRRFLADGRVTPEEELALAHLADEAGITIRRATEIRHEVEREDRGGAA